MLLHAAAARGHADILHLFIAHGADANLRDARGDTPLHRAAAQGHELSVWALLDRGNADWALVNDEGQSPLVLGYLLLCSLDPWSHSQRVHPQRQSSASAPRRLQERCASAHG